MNYTILILTALAIFASILWVSSSCSIFSKKTHLKPHPPPHHPPQPQPSPSHDETVAIKNLVSSQLGFRGLGYALLQVGEFKSGSSYSIKFDLKCGKPVFLWKMGKAGTRESPEYLLMYASLNRQGNVRFYQNSSVTKNTLSLDSTESVMDNRWHTIEIIRHEDTWTMKIDGTVSVSKTSQVKMEVVPDDILYIGGTQSGDVYPMIGCIRNMVLNGEAKNQFVTVGTVDAACSA
jgi:hypothetical protein